MPNSPAQGLTPTSIRLTDDEIGALEGLQQSISKWTPDTSISRSQVLKMALGRGVDALRHEVLIGATHLTARMRMALENHLPFPPVQGVEDLQDLAGLKLLEPKRGLKLLEPKRGLRLRRKAAPHSNKNLVASFVDSLPLLESARLLVHEPLFAWPSGVTHCYWAEGKVTTLQDWVLHTERWQQKGWGQIRFFQSGVYVIGLISFVDQFKYHGPGVVNGIEDAVSFLSSALDLDWRKIVWMDHRPVSVFKDYLGGRQGFTVIELTGEVPTTSYQFAEVYNPSWVGVNAEQVGRLLGIDE